MTYDLDLEEDKYCYEPVTLLELFGEYNCYVLGKELYVVYPIEGTLVISFYRLTIKGYQKISEPSDNLLECAVFEASWMAYEDQVLTTRLAEPVTREPDQSDIRSIRHSQPLPVRNQVNKSYGKVDYLTHIVRGAWHFKTT